MRTMHILLQIKGHDLVGQLGTEFRWSTIVLSKMHMSEIGIQSESNVSCLILIKWKGQLSETEAAPHVLELRLPLYVFSYLQRTMMILILLLLTRLYERRWMTSFYF